jgi:hypothetical protein
MTMLALCHCRSPFLGDASDQRQICLAAAVAEALLLVLLGMTSLLLMKLLHFLPK